MTRWGSQPRTLGIFGCLPKRLNTNQCHVEPQHRPAKSGISISPQASLLFIRSSDSDKKKDTWMQTDNKLIQETNIRHNQQCPSCNKTSVRADWTSLIYNEIC